MQDIVNFLIQNPDVIEKVVEGKASLLGVRLDELKVVADGIRLLGYEGGGMYWH
jgi:competence protein ComX